MPADPPAPDPKGVRIFISYAHVDEDRRQRLRAHLARLEREGWVHAWDDREIPAGTEWADEIDVRLDQADLILLLVSADFIRSDYCFGKELTRALERHDDPDDRAIVIPVILAPCEWEGSPIGRLQALPLGARPLAEWPSEEHFFNAVVKGLRQRIRTLVAPGDAPWERVFARLRDPRWWQRPAAWTVTGAMLLASFAAAWWWRRQAQLVDAEVAVALLDLRSGRYSDAAQRLDGACRRWISRGACFALEKARLGVQLEDPQTLHAAGPLERFGSEVERLRARAPDDPDLLLFGAELALREGRPEREAQAFRDIARAIELTGGRYPEAHFYLADLHLSAGEYDQALLRLDLALKGNEVAPDHYLNARAVSRARRGDLQGAIGDHEQAGERGSILSRIEIAPLLWSRGEYERARDRLLAAERALASAAGPPAGRNALPWLFDVGAHDPLVLTDVQDKRCLTHSMALAGRALVSGGAPGAAGTTDGPCSTSGKATEVRAAVAVMLAEAVRYGMEPAGRQRAADFARLHGLPWAP